MPEQQTPENDKEQAKGADASEQEKESVKIHAEETASHNHVEANSPEHKNEENRESSTEEAGKNAGDTKEGPDKDPDQKKNRHEDKLSEIENKIDASQKKLEKLRGERSRFLNKGDKSDAEVSEKKINEEERNLDDLISQYSKQQGITKDAAKDIMSRPKDQRGIYTKTKRIPLLKRFFAKLWQVIQGAAMYIFEHNKYKSLQMEAFKMEKERAEKIIQLDQLAHAKETEKTADRMQEICKDTKNPADRLRAAMNLCAETRQNILLKHGEELLRLSYQQDPNEIEGKRDAKIIITRFGLDKDSKNFVEINPDRKMAVPCVDGKVNDFYKDISLYKGLSQMAEKLTRDIERQDLVVAEKESAFKEAHQNLTRDEINYCRLAESRDEINAKLKTITEQQKQEPDNYGLKRQKELLQDKLIGIHKELKANPFFKKSIDDQKAARGNYCSYKEELGSIEKEKTALGKLQKQMDSIIAPADKETIHAMNDITQQSYNGLFRQLNGRDPEEEKAAPATPEKGPDQKEPEKDSSRTQEAAKEENKEDIQPGKADPPEVNRIVTEIASAGTIEYSPKPATIDGKNYIVPGYGINRADGHERFVVRSIQDPAKTLPLKISMNEANRKTQAIMKICATHESLEKSGWRFSNHDQEKDTGLEVTRYGTLRLRGEEKTLEYPIAAIEKDYPNLFRDAVVTFNETYAKEIEVSAERSDAMNVVIIQNDDRQNIGIDLSKPENDPMRVFVYARGEDLSTAERQQADPQKITKEAREVININHLDKECGLDNFFEQTEKSSHNSYETQQIPSPEAVREEKTEERGQEEEKQEEER